MLTDETTYLTHIYSISTFTTMVQDYSHKQKDSLEIIVLNKIMVLDYGPKQLYARGSAYQMARS